jgi:hypothetical protein
MRQSKIEQGSFPQHQAVSYLRWPLFIFLDCAVHAMTWYDRLVTCSLQSPRLTVAKPWRSNGSESVRLKQSSPSHSGPGKSSFMAILRLKLGPPVYAQLTHEVIPGDSDCRCHRADYCPAAYHRLFNTHCQRLTALR